MLVKLRHVRPSAAQQGEDWQESPRAAHPPPLLPLLLVLLPELEVLKETPLLETPELPVLTAAPLLLDARLPLVARLPLLLVARLPLLPCVPLPLVPPGPLVRPLLALPRLDAALVLSLPPADAAVDIPVVEVPVDPAETLPSPFDPPHAEHHSKQAARATLTGANPIASFTVASRARRIPGSPTRPQLRCNALPITKAVGFLADSGPTSASETAGLAPSLLSRPNEVSIRH